jgi:glutamate racemase
MDTRPVVFLDSGIGGIPYCADFHRRNPSEKVLYVADRAHFPYGKRSREDLEKILGDLMERLIALAEPKLAVLACNTATVSAIDFLRARFPNIPFVGTVPAVKPAVSASEKRHIGILGTERTIADPYIAELAARYGPDCAITAIAAPELVDFVEYRYAKAGAGERLDAALPHIRKFREAGADALVLGCTHFLFLLEEFRRAAAPDIKIYDSIDGISRRVESLLDEDQGRLRTSALSVTGTLSATGAGAGGPNIFYITGTEAPEPSWWDRADSLGFNLALLDAKPGTLL